MMQFGFQQTTLAVKTRDGLDDILLEPLVFLRGNGDLLRAPKSSTTDGVSAPKFLWWLIPPVGGDDYFSAVMHDAAYRGTLQLQTGVWTNAKFTRKQADDLILEAMTFQAVHFLMRWTVYLALRLFGGFAFKLDRKKTGL
jgi:hypothetical protein